MKYMVRLSDSSNHHMVLITLPEEEVQKSALDVVFDIVGCKNLEELVKENVISDAQLEDLKAFQRLIFAQDEQGLFIKNGVNFTANGKDLDPDRPFASSFVPAELEGMKYLRCDLQIVGALNIASTDQSAGQRPTPEPSQQDQVQIFASIMFLHQVALGVIIDVTKDHPEIDDIIARAEKEELIEIDVQKAAYRLTPKGKALHDGYMEEAQELIKKFDIYGDVDLDDSGNIRFDTGLGRDLRVPVFELNGVDPFRARLLLGLSDGEWDHLSNWAELIKDTSWYQRIFEPIEQAPSVEQIGQGVLVRVQNEAKTVLRREMH